MKGARTLLAGLVIVGGMLLAGAGMSSAGDVPESSLVVDGATAVVALIKGTATLRGDDPLKATGFAEASAISAGELIFNGGGPVTCLDVRGNTAGAVVRIETSTNPVLNGRYSSATFVDGGPGGVDRFGFVVLPTQPSSCAPVPSIAVMEFVEGGFEVRDGTRR